MLILQLHKSNVLKPNKLIFLVIDIPFETAIDVLIPEKLPGPSFIKILFIFLSKILFFSIKLNSKTENCSKLFLLLSKN